jgi:hypothetical protein
VERIREQIRVAVIFGPGGKVTPKWFDLKQRRHDIKEITYRWTDRVGDATRLHFTVTDGGALYELVYDTKEQGWIINSLQVEN